MSNDEPTIVFLFELKKWYENINPLTKIELIDIAPVIGTQLFFDFQANGYVLVITKTKWTGTSQEAKRRFMTISRRLKEEIEGPMVTIDRDIFEASDLFEIFDTQKKQQQETATIDTATVIDTTESTLEEATSILIDDTTSASEDVTIIDTTV